LIEPQFSNCNRDHDRNQKQIRKNCDPILIAGSDPDLFVKINPRFSSANRAAIENRFLTAITDGA